MNSSIDVEIKDDKYCCIRVKGYFNADLVLKIKDKINEMIEKNSPFIILNLGEVSEMNSTVLGIIVSRLRRIRNLGGDIRIANISPDVQQIFTLIGADRIFEIYSTEDDTIKSFKS